MRSPRRPGFGEKGFDPDGDLCEAIESKQDPEDGKTSAMYEVSMIGEQGLCRYLYDHGAASTIQSEGCFGQTFIC